MFGNHNTLSLSSRVVLVIAVVFATSTFATHAALKDSDMDGITDEAETTTYHTDLQKSDTDGDGFDDGYEVVNHADPLSATSTPFATPETSSGMVRIAHSIPNNWLLGVLGGMAITALVSLVLLRRFRAHTESAAATPTPTVSAPTPPVIQ